MIELLTFSSQTVDEPYGLILHVQIDFRVLGCEDQKQRFIASATDDLVEIHGWKSREAHTVYFKGLPDFDHSHLRELPDGNYGFTEEYSEACDQLRNKYCASIVCDREYVDALVYALDYNPETEVFTFEENLPNNSAAHGILQTLKDSVDEPWTFKAYLELLAQVAS